MTDAIITKKQLLDDLHAIGLQAGDVVLVHSSYKAIGKVDGGPMTFLAALADTLSENGTTLMPNLNISREFTVNDPPHFDLKNDSVKSLGIIPELFKFNYADTFSIHPTHSLMARGPAAAELLSGHETACKPCGPGTPYAKLGDFNAKILLIGVDQSRNTTYHHIEEAFDPSTILPGDIVNGTVILDGKETTVPSRMHCRSRRKSDFNRINKTLEADGNMKTGKIGNAQSMCIKAKEFIETCMHKLEADKEFFLLPKT